MISRWRTSGFPVAIVMCAAGLAGAACASSPREVPPRVRWADYFASHGELAPDIARAMQAGHIVAGMDTKQVWVVLGEPARKTRFERSETDVWLYRAHSLQQDHYRLGTQGVRLIFAKDRLVVIEPI